MHCGGRGAVLCRDLANYVDMPFLRRTEEKAYASLLVFIVRNCLELIDAARITHSIDYV